MKADAGPAGGEDWHRGVDGLRARGRDDALAGGLEQRRRDAGKESGREEQQQMSRSEPVCPSECRGERVTCVGSGGCTADASADATLAGRE